jgi:hypothetical protein
MVLLRAASLLVLALWVGGLAVLAFVAAPTIFDILQAHDPAGGRALAGEVFGAAFARFQQWALVLGGLLILLLGARGLLGPRPRRLFWRMLAVAAMLAMGLTTATLIAPRIDDIRRSTAGAVAALPDTDPRKAEFSRLHAISNVLMLLTLLTGVGLTVAEAKDH